MTPNPNPSPEATPGPYIIVEGTMIGSIAPVPHDLEISDWYDQHQKDGPDYRFVAETATDTNEGRANAKMIVAALSPQTLPAPGEVERLRAALKAARDALTNYADPTGYTDNNGDQYEEHEVSHPGRLAICTLAQIDALLDPEATPTLATVAAANDEGVEKASCTCGSPYYDLGEHAAGCPSTADDAAYVKGRKDALNDAARVAESWCCSKQAAGAANATFASINIAAAIRLLSQGGGK